MDEKEYLRKKEKIREYKTEVYPLGVIGGIVCITLGLIFGCVCETFTLFLLSLPPTAIGMVALTLGLWARRKAKELEIELEVYDKERERRKTQQPVQPAAAEPIAQLQYCPSCGKTLQPYWKVCGYCGKRLKKSA